jgi:predicted transcriptional regulator
LHCLAFCVILCFCDETLINLDLSGDLKMTAKTVNYTPEQTAQMVADYQAGTTVEAIAEALGKTVRSVVAKLSREKVYKAKTYVSKTGEAVIKKDAVADYIGEALGLGEADVESLTKANKTALKAIADFIKAEKT